jgi:hypothetical protein
MSFKRQAKAKSTTGRKAGGLFSDKCWSDVSMYVDVSQSIKWIREAWEKVKTSNSNAECFGKSRSLNYEYYAVLYYITAVYNYVSSRSKYQGEAVAVSNSLAAASAQISALTQRLAPPDPCSGIKLVLEKLRSVVTDFSDNWAWYIQHNPKCIGARPDENTEFRAFLQLSLALKNYFDARVLGKGDSVSLCKSKRYFVNKFGLHLL